MKNDEFEVIENPLLVLGGYVPGGDDDPDDDTDEDQKDERNGWQKFWDWALGRNK